MSQATAIDHIAIYVSDMDNAKKFFIEGLGLTIHGDYGNEFFMEVGAQLLAIFKGRNRTQTINHIALRVNDFTGVKRRLERLGYNVYKQDMVDGPDGIRVQLVQ